jgi:hypothetical protein
MRTRLHTNTRGSPGADLAATIFSHAGSCLSVRVTLNRRCVSNTDKDGETKFTTSSPITHRSRSPAGAILRTPMLDFDSGSSEPLLKLFYGAVLEC